MIQVSRPSLRAEESELVNKVFDSGWLGSGKFVAEFEKSISDFLGTPEVIAVSTGTSALHLGLNAAGVGSGDEVIVPSLTFCACIQAILMCSAKPVFCEVLPDTLCIDHDHIERLINLNTKAIMPVHYAGIPSEMNRILDIGRMNNIPVVEDAAHAFGSSFEGRMIGSFGDITCFSFDPIKNITCGEGGAVVVNNNTRISSIVRLRKSLGINREAWWNHESGFYSSHEVTDKGYRYHMSNINAAIGLAQLKKAESFRLRKSNIVKKYNSAFSPIAGISLLNYTEEVFPFIYTMRVLGNRRDDLMKYLLKNDISSSINYVPNHLQPAFKTNTSLPVTEKLFAEIITLPLFVDMTDDEVDHVIEVVIEFFR